MRIWQGRRILGKWLWIARSRRNRHTTTESARLLFSKLLPDHVRDGEHERMITPEEALCGTSSFVPCHLRISSSIVMYLFNGLQ